MKQKILKRTNRMYDCGRFGLPQIRIHHRQAVGKKTPRYLLKCGCCEEKLEICYDVDGLEIGGVHGSIKDWREILLPLLFVEQKGAGYIDKISKKIT